jgi:hypothetical protein
VSIIDETRFVERFQFFNGQRLFASDLQGLEEFNREMRWLHNQSLHQLGVGNGFAVNGKRGDRQVTIGPGYATDSMGREIILTEQLVDPIPPVAGNQGEPIFFDLTVSYPDDSTLEETETREGVCVGRGVIRLREEPVFCWVELAGEQLAPKKQKLKAELEAGLKIRLARIEVLNCELYSDVSIDQRQNARPPLTPYIFSNTEPLDPSSVFAGSLALQHLPTPVEPLLIVGHIDTSAAEFLTTPEYRAHFAGFRHFFLNTTAPGPIEVVIFDQFQIPAQRRESFDFTDLVLVTGIGPNPVDLEIKDVLDDRHQVKPNVRRIDEVLRLILADWKVVWMGIEG